MSTTPLPPAFVPHPPDGAGVISWIHIGDLHVTGAGEQNYCDLLSIISTINAAFADGVSFVFLPGDIADHGRAEEYALVREALDRLTVPWCCIVGDHDVQQKSFTNYRRFMAKDTRYAFSVGKVRFLALNAFDDPDPGSFVVLPEQLDWLKNELQMVETGSFAVLLLHCYPSDLKQGGDRLRELVHLPAVRLIDMGHTHYNEVANDGGTLYTATRSTGQIEEGPVGFSVTHVDGDVVSWKFFELGTLPGAMITSPADGRLRTDAALQDHVVPRSLRVRVKAWSDVPVASTVAHWQGREIQLTRIPGSSVWEGEMPVNDPADGVHPLSATVVDAKERRGTDTICVALGKYADQPPVRAERDQDNAIGAWPERGLLGTQLGPNKNGRKW